MQLKEQKPKQVTEQQKLKVSVISHQNLRLEVGHSNQYFSLTSRHQKVNQFS